MAGMCDAWEYQAKLEWSDVTGEERYPNLVEEGCRQELETFQQMGVYEYVLRVEAMVDKYGNLAGVM